MLFFTVLVKDITFTLAAFVLGRVGWSFLNKFCKLILVQVLVYLVIYVLSHAVVFWQKSQHLPLNNQFIWNTHLVLETSIIILACFYFFTKPWKKKLAILLWLLFLITWSWQAIENG